jgi:hypothetical protein
MFWDNHARSLESRRASRTRGVQAAPTAPMLVMTRIAVAGEEEWHGS